MLTCKFFCYFFPTFLYLRYAFGLLFLSATLLPFSVTLLKRSATLLPLSVTLLERSATLLELSATLLTLSATLLERSATLLELSAGGKPYYCYGTPQNHKKREKCRVAAFSRKIIWYIWGNNKSYNYQTYI